MSFQAAFSLMCLLAVAAGDIMLEERGYLKLSQAINDGEAHESAWDPIKRHLYVISERQRSITIVDINNPDNPTSLATFTFPDPDLHPLDVDFCGPNAPDGSANGILAISFRRISIGASGEIYYYRGFQNGETELTRLYGDYRTLVEPYPDNIKFGPLGCNILAVSSEAPPGIDATQLVDPEGSISIVEFSPSPGVNPTKKDVKFDRFDNTTNVVNFLNEGGRYFLRRLDNNRINSLKHNLEPEYVVFDNTGQQITFTLQENNAIGRIDLRTQVPTLTWLHGLGYKEFSSSTLDASSTDGGIAMQRRKVYASFQPDKIIKLAYNGVEYLLTTNEGKNFKYPGDSSLNDHGRASALLADGRFGSEVTGDAELVAALSDNSQLGEVEVSIRDEIGIDDPLSKVILFGGRSISIYRTTNNDITRVYDTGDEIEKVSRWFNNCTFNSRFSDIANRPIDDMDKGSTLYGPQVNTIATGVYNDTQIVVFGGGSNGMIYVYQVQSSVTSTLELEFQSVHRRGGINLPWQSLFDNINNNNMGDIGITDMIFVDDNTPDLNGKPLLIVVSETSGSVSVYSFTEGMFPGSFCPQTSLCAP